MPAHKRSWSKAPSEHVDAFVAALPQHPLIKRRQMFGYACAFVRGNMLGGVHEANICVRLGAPTANQWLAAGRAAAFAPMAGRVMKDCVAVPTGDCSDPLRLAPWLAAALEYTRTLPAKAPKKARLKKA